jgi:hypothetical protein
MASDKRKQWQEAKKTAKAENNNREFELKGGLGPKLEDYDKARDGYDKLRGKAKPADLEKAKKKVNDLVKPIHKILQNYMTEATKKSREPKGAPDLLEPAFDTIDHALRALMRTVVDV